MHYEAFVMHNAQFLRSAICIFIRKSVKQRTGMEEFENTWIIQVEAHEWEEQIVGK